MQDAMLSYFEGEKNGGLLLVAVGAACLALAVLFLQPRWELRSFAWTLGVLALAEIALGAGLFLRTAPQVNGLLAQLGGDAAQFFAQEGSRMARVQRTFVIVQYVEVIVIVVAALVAFTQKSRFWIVGIALALLCHAAFLLAFDLVAERRGAVYLAEIEARRAR